MMFGAAELSN